MSKKRVVIAALAILILIIGGVTVRRFSNREAESALSTTTRKVPVSVEMVQQGDMEKTIRLGGLLQPLEAVYLISKNPYSRIDAIPAKVGQQVKVGDPIVIFDSQDLDIQYNQAQLDFARNKQLYEAGAISQYQLEQYQNALDILKIQKENLLLKSPVDGIVSSVSAVVGQLAGNSAIAGVVDISRLKLQVQVGESHVNKMKVGESMDLAISAISSEKFQGIITSVPPNIDPVSKSYPITLEIDNAEGLIKGGMYGEVQLLTEKKENVIVIPQFAIITQEQKEFVFVVENDTAKRREIKVGLTLGDKAEITEGLSEGELLVVEGQYGLKDGSNVAPAGREGQQ